MCYLFVFRHPILIGCIVLTDKEDNVWLALAKNKELSVESVKSEFTLVAKLEVPGLAKQGE